MKRVSLTQYLVEQQREHGRIPAELRLLIEVVARACKRIAIAVNKGALGDVLGSAASENVQGEVQKKLDVLTNDIFIRTNEWGGQLAGMVSEEMEKPYVIPAEYPTGKYLLLFDPLDGSSNVDVNVAVVPKSRSTWLAWATDWTIDRMSFLVVSSSVLPSPGH